MMYAYGLLFHFFSFGISIHNNNKHQIASRLQKDFQKSQLM